MAAEFRILGEVEALVDGRRLDVGHARQRCVLASLLVDVNRPVSAEQLINRVWSLDPPHKARNALAAYISRLRQLLAATEGTEIIRSAAGYTLRADAQSVDLHLFRRLVSEARGADRPARAAAMFDQALALWRGEPFTPVETPWADELRGSLELERLSAILDRNDAALAAGRHVDLLHELTATMQAHPLDERVAGQLMLAQYRCGRQADALENYRAIRERLVEELGVDPGAALQVVHKQILDGDPVSPGSPPGQPTAPQIVVVQHDSISGTVPTRSTRLIGRQDDIRRVVAAVGNGPVITLTGVGGVGKTRLAFEIAAEQHRHFADGAWVCELAPLSDGSATGHAVAVALRVPVGYQQTPEDAVIEHLRTRQALLILDNCEHVLVAAGDLVERIAQECPQVTVLATSREPLGVEGERIVPVSPLAEDDAAELFAERARSSRPDFDPEQEPAGTVAEICRRLDGVPLAIELAAARMRAMSSLDVARRLDRLRLLSGGKRGAHPRQHSVTATIDWSYRLLSEAEQKLFSRLSVFAGGFDLEAAHRVCADDGTIDDDTVDILTGLVDKSMVVVRIGLTSTRYDVLETLRAYGRERLQDEGLADQAASRHAHYFVELAERASAGMRGPDEALWVQRILPRAGSTYVAPDFDNLRTAFEYAMDRQDIDLALRLTTSLPEIHIRIGYHPMDWVERSVQAADPNHPLLPAAVGTVARGYQVLGEFARARVIAALAQGREPHLGHSFLAYPADVIADVAMNDGDPVSSTAYFEELFAGADATTDPLRIVLAAERITLGHQMMETLDSSVGAAREAVRIADATGNPTARSLARSALGRALSHTQPDQASENLTEAIALAASVENTWLIALATMELATVHDLRGAPAVSARGFLTALEMWVVGGRGRTIPLQWDNLRRVTQLLLRVGACEQAVALHRAAVAAGRRPPLSAAQMADLDGVDSIVPADLDVADYANAALRGLID